MGVDARLLFLDADVLAAPVTRTLLLAGADQSGLRVTWSGYAETEADRHLRRSALSVSALRMRLGRELGPTGLVADRFPGTSPKDRQILADAEASGAGFLITRNVADFAEDDLVSVRVAAVDPDLFMATRYTEDAYAQTLRLMVANMKHPPRTMEELHALIAKQHPRLFERHARLFDVVPASSGHNPPREVYRGSRCMLCGRRLSSPRSPDTGLGPECMHKV